MYEVLAPNGLPWRGGFDTAQQAYRAAANAPEGSTVRRERDRVRVSPLGALIPGEEHLVAVASALPGTEDIIAAELGMPIDLVMATLGELSRRGHAAWIGLQWTATTGGKAA